MIGLTNEKQQGPRRQAQNPAAQKDTLFQRYPLFQRFPAGLPINERIINGESI